MFETHDYSIIGIYSVIVLLMDGIIVTNYSPFAGESVETSRTPAGPQTPV